MWSNFQHNGTYQSLLRSADRVYCAIAVPGCTLVLFHRPLPESADTRSSINGGKDE